MLATTQPQCILRKFYHSAARKSSRKKPQVHQVTSLFTCNCSFVDWFAVPSVVKRLQTDDVFWWWFWSTKTQIFPISYVLQTHTHTRTHLTALFPGLPGWGGTGKVKPIWILLKQDRMSGSGISWAICKSAPHSRQTTTPAPHHSVFLQALPVTQPTASKHWRLQQRSRTKTLLQAHCTVYSKWVVRVGRQGKV